MIYLQIAEVKSGKSNWVHKSQIIKIPQLRKVRKSKKIWSANLRICVLRNLFADRPPLLFIDPWMDIPLVNIDLGY
jgi:hypothetical protein